MKKAVKKILAGILSITMALTMIPSLRGFAEKSNIVQQYPYVMFAADSGDSIVVNSKNFTVNGEIHTNGIFNLTTNVDNTNGEISNVEGSNVVSSKNSKINSKIKSVENEDLIIIKDKVISSYFSDNCEVYNNNLEININDYSFNTSKFSNKAIYLTSNCITANANLGANGLVSLAGNSFNGNKINIYSENGDISLKFKNTIINGLIYAPNGKVTIDSNDVQLNGVIIAKEINIKGDNVNLNYNEETSIFIGKTSEINYTQLADGQIETEYLSKVIYPGLISKGLSVDNILLSDDYDNDGLTTIEEYNYDTNPFSSDTDDDGLNDFDEIFVYHTNPNYWDTDNDTMSDGTEVSCGLNPLLEDSNSNGIKDNEEIVKQNVRIDLLNSININESLVEPSVEITGAGDFSRRLYVQDISYDETISDIHCLVGHPFEFVHDENLNFESSKLTFKISDNALKNNKLEDLAIAYYNEVDNTIEIVDTTIDKDTNSISADVQHYSIYFVINIIDYYYDIDWLNLGSVITHGKADVVFVIDTTGSMNITINDVKNNISDFVDKLATDKVDIRLGLVEFSDIINCGNQSTKDHGWFKDVDSFKTTLQSIQTGKGVDETPIDGLDVARKKQYRIGAEKYIILVTDESYYYGVSYNRKMTMNEEIDYLKNDNINVSVITKCYLRNVYYNLYHNTNGVLIDIDKDFSSGLNPLISNMGHQVNDGCWIRLSNGSVVKLDKDPNLGDYSIDSDGDGIPDLNELARKKTVRVINPWTKSIDKIETWSFYSNPIKKDTDGDKLPDIVDLNPNRFDVRAVNSNDNSKIVFNTGHSWNKLTQYLDDDKISGYTAEQALQLFDVRYVDISDTINIVWTPIIQNAKSQYSFYEMCLISTIDNEGSKLYLDGKSESLRDNIFKVLFNRDTKYYKHTGMGNSDKDWSEVSSYKGGGYYKGKILSESDINFSRKLYTSRDIYDECREVLVALAAVAVFTIAFYTIYAVTAAVIETITILYQASLIYGVPLTLEMYMRLGKNGVIAFIQMALPNENSSINETATALMKIFEQDISDGKIFLEDISPEAKYVNDLANQIAEKATHTGNINEVVLGKFNVDGINYVDVAIKNGSTYYSLPTECWNKLNKYFGQNFMQLINQRFIEQQASKGAIFNYSHPLIEDFLTGDFKFEMDFIEHYFSELQGELVN